MKKGEEHDKKTEKGVTFVGVGSHVLQALLCGFNVRRSTWPVAIS